MEHPLIALVSPAHLPEAEQDELWRSVAALQSAGWSRHEVARAIELAIAVAGDELARQQQPLVICDDQDGPFVAVRLPVLCSARAATDLSQHLRARLKTRELDRPGLSISFWSISPREGTRSRVQ